MPNAIYTYTCPTCEATIGTDVAIVEAVCHCPTRKRVGRRTTAVMALTHVNTRRQEALAAA